MNNYVKSQCVVPLMLAAHVGIIVRGFNEIARVGNGGVIESSAASMYTESGEVVESFHFNWGFGKNDPITVRWTAGGVQHEKRIRFLVSDAGEVKFETETTVVVERLAATPGDPTWR